MLYSIGKDSSVLVRLAIKAFHPMKLPFPLLHIDTTWKFREMIQFRDEFTKQNNLDLIVHTNQQGVADDINPFDHGSEKYTDVMKTQALKQALSQVRVRRSVRRRAPRRRDVARQRAHVFVPRPLPPVGSRRTSGPSCGTCTTPRSTRARASACSRSRTGPSSTSGSTSTSRSIPVVPLYFAKPRPVVEREGALIMVDDERMRLVPGEKPQTAQGALPHARLLSAVGRDRVRAPTRCRRSSKRCCSPGTPSARAGLIDHDEDASMEKKKREGYF